MNKQIRRLGLGLVACYVALFAMLNWIQVIKADDYNNHPLNTAKVRQEFNRERGTITSADGALLAISVDNPDTDVGSRSASAATPRAISSDRSPGSSRSGTARRASSGSTPTSCPDRPSGNR